jgi:two-component system alkaline phosphatase synthesis response regulator PhoP
LVDSTEHIELALQQIVNVETDLVISSKKLNEYHDFEVFIHLKPALYNAGIPFFMVLEEFDRDDVLIGLEMGIDNFLFLPYNEPVIVHTIENWLKKKSDINLFETVIFKNYFYTTSVAMFFNSNGKISLVNEAFCRLTGKCGNQILGEPVEELFFLEEIENNKMNYRRFKSGVTNECHLKNVKWHNNKEISFDITFFRGKINGTNDIFAEMLFSALPANKTKHEISNSELPLFKGNQVDREEILICNVRLTEREKQVYIFSAQGMALKQIANKLNLSQRTVEKHRSNIMHKTNTSNFIETMIKIGPVFSNLLQK